MYCTIVSTKKKSPFYSGFIPAKPNLADYLFKADKAPRTLLPDPRVELGVSNLLS
jgi:hypothetical protein